MVTKKDIMELKRRFKKEDCTIQRLSGCYVNGNREKVVTFSETFLNLEEEEFYKYLEIAKKTLSGTLGNNILELPFPLEAEEAGGMQQFFMGVRQSELKNPDLLERLYDQIIENYDYAGNYLILVFYDVYDVPLKTSDNMKLDESEEMFPYLLTAICPVNLSKPGLGYLPDDNKIGPRIRDWVVEMPDVGFLFPSFAQRGADIHSLTYYVKDPKDSKRSFVEAAFGCGSKFTSTEQRLTFHAIVKRCIAPITGEDDSLLLNIQESLQNQIPVELDDSGEEIRDEAAPLTRELIAQVLEENEVPDGISTQIQEHFKEAFEAEGEELPPIASVIDTKKLAAAEKEKREEELEGIEAQMELKEAEFMRREEELTEQVNTLQQELVDKSFTESQEADEASGFSQTYDVILRVKPDKVGKIHSTQVDGKRCVVIPLEEGEYVNLNGINTQL